MKKHLPNTLTWALAITLTARLTWTLIQHNVPALATATIAASLLYTTKAGAQHVVNTLQTPRQNGATR